MSSFLLSQLIPIPSNLMANPTTTKFHKHIPVNKTVEIQISSLVDMLVPQNLHVDIKKRPI
jgi:hypothetical protein